VFTALTIATYQLAFFGGVARTGVAVGTIVGIGSAPIMAGVLGWWIDGERPGPRWIGATLLAIAGCGLLVLPGDKVQVDGLGILLALGAGLSYALYTMSSKRLLAIYPPDTVMAVGFCGGALILLPLLWGRDLRWVLEPSGLLVALHLGLVATGLSYALFGRGLKSTPAATAVTLSLAEPLTAGVLGIVVVGEQLVVTTILGIGLLLGGLAWLVVPLSVIRRRNGFLKIKER
jgi:DME family drug/metabolite transporter